jgi:hypothetical protein
VRHYPHAGFIHHRHTQGQTSLSWRNVIMALPLTQEGIYTIAPARDTWLAQPVVADEPDCQDLQRLHVIEREDAFAVAMSIDRCQGSLQQQVLFASLPDGRALSYERLLATRDCRLESLEQGFIRITNETFPLLDNGCRGERVLYGESGDTTYRGWIGDDPSDDIVDELRGPSWLNIDDRLGIRCAGSGTGQYRNRHHYEAYQVIADDLVISSEKPRALYQGDTAGVLAALVCPGQRHGATATAVFQLIEAEDSIALLTDDALTATNFGEETVDVLFPLSMSQSAESGSAESGSSIFESVPVFAGMTTVVASDLSLHVELRPGHPVLSRLVVTATVAGSCRLEATGNGIYATASTDCDLSLSDDTRHLAAGESTLFEIPTARKSHP